MSHPDGHSVPRWCASSVEPEPSEAEPEPSEAEPDPAGFHAVAVGLDATFGGRALRMAWRRTRSGSDSGSGSRSGSGRGIRMRRSPMHHPADPDRVGQELVPCPATRRGTTPRPTCVVSSTEGGVRGTMPIRLLDTLTLTSSLTWSLALSLTDRDCTCRQRQRQPPRLRLRLRRLRCQQTG
jgi:hypothetical protein